MSEYVTRKVAFTLFCDDLRREVDEKFSAIGIYQEAMILSEKTQTLPKFVALTVLEVPAVHAPARARLALYDRETILVEGYFSLTSPEGSDENTHANLSMPIEASPFVACDGMELQVRFSAGSFEYKSSVMRVFSTSPFLKEEQVTFDSMRSAGQPEHGKVKG